jgi:organic radical activating enzyme
MYDNYEFSNLYMKKILKSIDIVNKCDAITEFVITGGEPLIDLKILKRLVAAMEKPVYINTSLPKVDNIDKCIEFINKEQKIRGVNISRHLGNIYNVSTCDKDKIDQIKKYKRINCIIKPEYVFEEDKLFKFIDHFADEYTMINFRADYRMVTTDTLKNRDKIDEWLMNNYRYEHSANCLVCNSEFFSDDKSTVICYHRGLEHSKVVTKNYIYVNDVLIDLYGNIHDDWDMNEDPSEMDCFMYWLETYREEEYDDDYEDDDDDWDNEDEEDVTEEVKTTCKTCKKPVKYHSSCGGGYAYEYNPSFGCGGYSGCGGGYSHRYSSCGSSGCGGGC